MAFGYSAKAGSIKDRKTGEPQDVVFINGLGSINAYLNLSSDPGKFGLKVFGNLPEGYAPVVLDDDGRVIRETVIQNGERITRAKRGEALDAEALKRKNNEISLVARKEISAAVLAAYMLEASGGDLEMLREGFRLQKWERNGQKPALDGQEVSETAIVDLSAEFTEAADPASQTEATVEAAQTRRKVKREKGLSL
ncbi:MAG: hypothetical protein EBS23_00780 [Betaproteobacteria bacterium]|nr:hypothetical protein [Betaproteobacteria bacterium]